MSAGTSVQTDGTISDWYATPGDDSYEGTQLAEYFWLGLGDDILQAAGGNDKAYADLGDDWLDGGRGSDTLSFLYVGGAGTYSDASEFGVIFDLARTTQDLGYWGVKTIYSFENVEGSDNADRLYGTSGVNIFLGYGGNDVLDARSGRDIMNGGLGKDTIVSGAGGDVLAGDWQFDTTDEGGRDYFRYSKTSDSGITSSTRDVIWGCFSGTHGDKIDVSRIDANGAAAGNGTFKFIGSSGFHPNSTGEVRVKSTGNTNEYMVSIDIDTDTAAEMTILVHSTTALTRSDFIL